MPRQIRKLAYWSNQRKNLNSEWYFNGEWYFLLAPLAVLAVLLLFRFVCCQIVFALGPYRSLNREEDLRGIVPLDEKNSEDDPTQRLTIRPFAEASPRPSAESIRSKGEFRDVTIYNKALSTERIMSHTGAGLNLAE